jgi:hypothetical protein
VSNHTMPNGTEECPLDGPQIRRGAHIAQTRSA